MAELNGIRIIATPSGYGACIHCGAHDEHPNPDLKFPNRQKVDDFWKCYNPNCDVGYYQPETGEWEKRLTAEEEKALNKRCKEWVDNLMKDKEWVTKEGRELLQASLEPIDKGI